MATKAELEAELAALKAERAKAEAEAVKVEAVTTIDIAPRNGESVLLSGVCGAHNKPTVVYFSGICSSEGARHESCAKVAGKFCQSKVYRYEGCFGCGAYARREGVKLEATIGKAQRKRSRKAGRGR